MAAEIPVIATTAGGIADFLFDNENGLEVQIDSIDDVVSKTNLLMGDFVLKEKIVKNGRESIQAYKCRKARRDGIRFLRNNRSQEAA